MSGITLNQTALTLTLGDTSVLKATVDPENATVQTVTWSAEPAGGGRQNGKEIGDEQTKSFVILSPWRDKDREGPDVREQ